MTTTITLWRIIASAIDANGTRVAADTGEILGGALGVTYATEVAAQSVCDDLGDTSDETGLDGVEYSLSPVTVRIEQPEVDVDVDLDDDGEGHLLHVVSCVVRVEGRKYDTLWYAAEAHIGGTGGSAGGPIGIYGLQPVETADAWCDREIYDDLGVVCAVRIGREVLASVRLIPTPRGLEATS